MTKSVSWNEKTVDALVSAYVAVEKDNEQLGAIAKDLGKTVPAVRSKLVSLGEYQKAETPRKVGGASSVRKINIVRQISEKLGVSELSSLEKGSKADLEQLLQALETSE